MEIFGYLDKESLANMRLTSPQMKDIVDSIAVKADKMKAVLDKAYIKSSFLHMDNYITDIREWIKNNIPSNLQAINDFEKVCNDFTSQSETFINNIQKYFGHAEELPEGGFWILESETRLQTSTAYRALSPPDKIAIIKQITGQLNNLETTVKESYRTLRSICPDGVFPPVKLRSLD